MNQLNCSHEVIFTRHVSIELEKTRGLSHVSVELTVERASLANPASQCNPRTQLANLSRRAERWRFHPNCSQTILALPGTS